MKIALAVATALVFAFIASIALGHYIEAIGGTVGLAVALICLVEKQKAEGRRRRARYDWGKR